MRTNRTQKMVTIAVLAAISFVLMFLYFPVIPAFGYMTIDFSEIPILIGTYILGPAAGVGIAFIRSTLHFITTGASLPTLIGDVTSFIAALAYVLPVYYLSRDKSERKSLYLALVVGIVSLVTVMSLGNYFIITPLYFKVLGFDVGMPIAQYILVGVIPFNLIKGSIVSFVFATVHEKLLPWLSLKITKPIREQ